MNQVKQFQFTILTFLLLFLVAAMLLRTINIITLDPTELYGYGFILYGIATVYTTFGEGNKFLLFLGSVLFLLGIIISLPAHFEIVGLSNMYVPSAVLIAGISLFVVYFDNTENNTILIASLILLIAGVVLIFLLREIQFLVFLESIPDFIAVYWPILLIVSGITFILRR
jgi:hypothetical protein